MKNLILFILFIHVNYADSQQLIGEFENAFGGQFTDEDRIVMICNDCPDVAPNTVVFLRYNNSIWQLYDSLSVHALYPNMTIGRIKLTDDESTISIMLSDPSNTLLNDDDDILLIYKKSQLNWDLVFQKENIIINSTDYGAVYNTEFSEGGDTMILGYTNIEPGIGSLISEITLDIYSYNTNTYQLIETLKEELICDDKFKMYYYYSINEIIIAPASEIPKRDYYFIRYSFIDSIWQKIDDFLEIEDNEFDFTFLQKNGNRNNYLLGTSTFNSRSEKKITLEDFRSQDNIEFNREIIFQQLGRNYTLGDMAASEDLNKVAIGLYDPIPSSTVDTVASIEYLSFSENNILKQYSFSFPLIDFPGYYGDVGAFNLSPSGDKILLQRKRGTQVYDMSDFLSNTSSISEDDEYQHQNLTGSTIDLRQVEDLKIYNSIGQLIIETTTESIDLSAMPSGMYILHYLKEGSVTHVRKVMKF